MNKSFLYIEPYVYSVLKNKQILLYNTLSGDKIIETIKDKNLLLFLSKLLKNNKLRIIKFEENKNSLEIRKFIDKCKQLFMLDVHFGEKPFLIPFETKVMYDKKYLKSIDSINKISSQINQINIVLGKSTFCKNEILNSNGIRQFLFPYDCDKKKDIDAIKLINAISKIKFPLKTINIIGDYFRYSDYKIITEHFSSIFISHYAYYLDFEESFFENNTFENNNFTFWIDFPCDEININKMISFLKKKNIDFSLSFLVTSDKDVSELETLKLINANFNKNIIPFYNKHNIDFFKENVFIDDKDIFEQGVISNKQIFSNMQSNKLFFGKLYFLPDNKIYANPNFVSLGNLENDWTDILQKNLLNNPCWFKTRKMKPCANCIYQYLCPPISNYNLVIEKGNLCTLYHL
ncbi:MAG: hypothetical protein LBV69_07690 [Bacteroidales bacterium]|jgi:pseudo-rSAM protein|nr:hypothetical protein [Bacteroidales bacterium]